MKKFDLGTTLGVIGACVTLGAILLSGCGGGGGGGGGGGVVTKQSTNLYLFGTMSSSSIIANVQSKIIVPTFVDYTAPNKSVKGTYLLRSGVLSAAGPALASSVTGSYDNGTGLLIITVNSDPSLNMSSSTTANSGKGNLIATITTTPGTVFPIQDVSPIVYKNRSNNIDLQNGCAINYAP